MSDLADMAAESCGAVEGLRGIFVVAPCRNGRCDRGAGRELPKCSCGGKAGYRPHPPLVRGGPGTETLACAACGNAVGPFASRQALAQAWRLGGYRVEVR